MPDQLTLWEASPEVVVPRVRPPQRRRRKPQEVEADAIALAAEVLGARLLNGCRVCARASDTRFCAPCMARVVETSETGEAECYVDIPGREGHYQGSSFGNARSLDRTVVRKDGKTQRWSGIPVSQYKDDHGYPCISMYGGRQRIRVHNVIALAFLGPPPSGLKCATGMM